MFAYDEAGNGGSRGDRFRPDRRSGDRARPAAHRMRIAPDRRSVLADRMHDLEDLANRLLRIVSGQLSTAAAHGLRSDTILIARNLVRPELLRIRQARG